MNINPQRRVIIVSAISGVLVFGAAGFAAAATGGSHKVQAPVIAPAIDASTSTTIADTSSTSTDAPTTTVATTDSSLPGTSIGDDEGTEVENSTNSTEVGDD